MYKKRFLLQLMLIVVAGFLAARFLTAILTVMAHLGKRFSLRDIMIPSVVTGNTTQTVIAPFDPKRPVTVVILTYQRCGSSFFGQLFNTNPDVFYMYELLDSLYSALYGTKEGWNVPSDITTYANGTERIIPRSEEHAVAQFLGHILSCDVDSLPTETLVHRFLYIFSNFQVVLREFIRCLSRNKLKYTRCDSFTSSVCGKRFGEHTDDIHEKCNKFLWNEELRRTEIGELAKKTRQYRNCLDGMRSVLDRKCAALFRTKCSESNLRAVKTVRATMASMEYLLEKDVNFRVIHLIRDPRAVVLSRMNFDVSTRSLYAQNDLIKEAEVYCRDVVRDVRRRRLLEIKYPGRLMTVLYDELTKRPIFYAKEIYAFLNATLPRETIHWLEKNTNDIKNSTRIAKKWQWKLTYETAKHIRETCKTFFTEIQYDFP